MGLPIFSRAALSQEYAAVSDHQHLKDAFAYPCVPWKHVFAGTAINRQVS